MHYLYKATNLTNGKCYIGETRDLENRMLMHRFKSTSSRLLHDAIEAEGSNNFKFEVLVKGDVDYIKELEGKAILAFDTLEPKGYNLIAKFDGKEIYSEEMKKRKSEANSRRSLGMSKESRAKGWITRKLNKLSKETTMNNKLIAGEI